MVLLKRSHLEPFSPLKLALPFLGKRLGSTRAGSPGFVLRPLEIVSCPLKREGGRKRTLPPSLAWRGTMSFSLSSHKTDFERPHCLTLPLFVRRPLCREREEREERQRRWWRRTQKVRLRDVQSKRNGPAGEKETERGEG